MTKKPSVKTELITPEVALDYLTANTHNRPVRPSVVATLISELKSDSWNLALGKPISFSTEGVLIDGQHRLRAIYESGVSAFCVVAREVDPNIQLKLDVAFNARTLGDNLGLEGMKDAKRKVQFAKAILKLKRNDNRYTPDEVVITIDQHATGIEWALALVHGARHLGFEAANVRATLGVAFEKSPEIVTALAERAITGVGILSDGDPALMLQKACAKTELNEGSNGRRKQSMRILRVCYAAVKNERITKLTESDEALEYFITRSPRASVKTKKAA